MGPTRSVVWGSKPTSFTLMSASSKPFFAAFAIATVPGCWLKTIAPDFALRTSRAKVPIGPSTYSVAP
jgi:hypothetical protein